jgi:hypothetical protein
MDHRSLLAWVSVMPAGFCHDQFGNSTGRAAFHWTSACREIQRNVGAHVDLGTGRS